MTNRQLIDVGLRWFDWPARLSSARTEDERSIIEDIKLLAGDLSAARGAAPLSGEDRAALIKRLSTLCNDTVKYLRSLGDEDLAGCGAVTAFLLAAGIRDKHALARMSDDDQRNTLIVVNNKHVHIDGGQLQGMTNRQLIGVGLRWFDWPARLTSALAGDQRSIIEDIKSLVGYRDAWAEVGERLGWTCALLNALAKSDGAAEDRKLARLLAASALPLVENHAHGLDGFGKTPAFAPGMTFDTYADWVADSLADLAALETYYLGYFAALHDQKDAMADLNTALTNYSGQVNFIQSKADRASADCDDLEQKIGNLNTDLKTKRKNLVGTLDGFAANVRSAFGLSIETLFNCLSQLSFVNLSEPVHSLSNFTKFGGSASAAAMAGSQIGTIINEAATNVLNDFGEPVKRELLLKQISVVEENLDLRSEFTRLETGFISDDQSKRLVVQLAKFKELCSNFKNVAKDVPLLRNLDRYIEDITSRNTYIDQYNNLLRTRIDLAAELNRVKEQKSIVSGRLAIEAKPGLPAMSAFVSGLYERAKAEVIADLYLAYRAYALWALAPNDGFGSILGRNPQGSDAKQLRSAWQDIKTHLRKSVDKGDARPKEFPKDDASFGRIVVLRKDVHPRIFNDLLYESADLEILPATKSSSTPASDFDPTRTVISAFEAPPPDADSLANPFFNMCNVRLRKVRVWMVGMEVPGNRHYVEFVHLGQERFRTRLDLFYPHAAAWEDNQGQTPTASAYVEHDPVPITFVYDATDLRYDASKGKLNPGSLAGSTPALEDGDLSLNITDNPEQPLKSRYAPIGPFGKWQLSVKEQFNPGLKLDALNMIVIDFHGYYQTFQA